MPKLTGFPEVPLPGPAPIPLLGHLPRLVQFLGDPVGMLERLRTMGDVVGVCRNSPALVCVFGAEHNREVLTHPNEFRNDEDLLQGPEGSSLARMRDMIVCINGDRHKRHRRLIAPAFSKAALEGYVEPIVTIAESIVERWPRDTVVDLDAKLRELSLNVGTRCLFGVDVLRGTTALGELAARFGEASTHPLTLMLRANLPGSPYRRALRLGDTLYARLQGLVADKRQQTDPGHDALALLLQAVDDDGSGFSDDELMPEMLSLFFAGHETTAHTMTWTLFLLERHPDVLADVLDELDGVLGGRSITAEDIPRLPLLDCVIKESMRLFPATPCLFLRVLASETELGGVALPRGTNVIVSPYATHHDPAIHPDPKRFSPRRWERIKPSPYEYLPFGAGPRVCMGASFSRQSLPLILSTILQRTRLSLVRNARIDRLSRPVIFAPKHGLPARIEAPHRRRLTPEPIRGDVHEVVALA